MKRLLRYRMTPILATGGLGGWSLLQLAPVEAAGSVLLCIAAATWIIYPLDPILDSRDRGPLEGPRVSTVIRLILAAVVFTLAILSLRLESRIFAVSGLLLALLYSVPVAGHRIKDYSAIKIPFISLAVSLACLGLPWLQSGSTSIRQAMVPFLVMLMMVMCNVIVCDIRDHRRDHAAGLKTIATRSLNVARRVVMLLALAIFGSTWWLLHESAGGDSMLAGVGPILAAMTLLLASKMEARPTEMTILADGSLTLPVLFEWLSRG
ncbi:MAG: UbiA family prenyltransferase [Planctomycetes bacterium]|nr:UbiA family prenyltransferase [Planctomycetota bacterium]